MVKKSKPTQNKPRPKRAYLPKEVQARLSAFVNSSTDGFALLDDNLNYMFINSTAEKMIGVSREAVVGKNVLDVVPDIKESGRYDKYLEVLKTGEPFQVEDMVSQTRYGDIHTSLKAFRVESWLGLVFTDLTERKEAQEAQEALRDSEEHFRALLENAQDAIVILNDDGTMRYGSPSIERIWGYKLEDWSNKNYSEFVVPDDMQNAAEAFAILLQNPGSHIHTEMHVRHKKGSIRVIEALGKNLLDNPSINGIVINVRDITERKKLEEQERKRSHDLDLLSKAAISLVELPADADIYRFIAERLRELAQGSYILVNSFDEALGTFCMREVLGAGGRTEAVNKVLGFNLIGVATPISDEARQGLSSGKLEKVPGGIYDLASGALPIAVCQEIEKLMGVGNVYAIGFHWEGRLYGSAAILTRDRTELKNKDVIQTFVRQVSTALQRRRAEEALKESEEKYRALIEAAGRAGEGIIIIQDSDEREAAFVFANDEFCKMSGYSREELLTRSAWDLVSSEFAVLLKDWYKRRHKGEELPGHYEAAGIRKDGVIVPLDLSVVTVPWQGKTATVLYLRDITERKKAEEALKTREAFLDTIIEQTPSALWISDDKGTVVRMSQALRDLLEITDEEIIGKYNVLKDTQVMEQGFMPLVESVFEEGKTVTFMLDYHTEKERQVKLGRTTHKILDIVISPVKNEQGKILNVVCQEMDITERKRMEEALRQSEETVRRLAKASASAHEEERQRVALEVHDRISQTLTGAFHQLQALESIPTENAEAQQILKRALTLLQESIRESRSIMEDLYSPVLSDFGVVAVIDEELRRFQKDTGCRTKFDKRCTVRPTKEVELIVYRIFHEALTNIKKHAIGATEVKVSLSDEADVVSLQVRDNGPGFDVEAAMVNKRMGGLRGMQRRAELGGGTFKAVSSRGHGATITVHMLYTAKASAADEGEGRGRI